MTPWALQQAVYQRLAGFGPLLALVEGVHDDVPDDAAFPYVAIGESTGIPFDTDDSVGSESTLTLHVWSRYRGRKEVKQISGAIYDALHRYALSVTGAHTVNCEWDSADDLLDPDGVTRHGVVRFRIILEQED